MLKVETENDPIPSHFYLLLNAYFDYTPHIDEWWHCEDFILGLSETIKTWPFNHLLALLTQVSELSRWVRDRANVVKDDRYDEAVSICLIPTCTLRLTCV